MSRIDELIAEHCPNGVEFLPLKDIAVRITDGSHNPPKGTLGGEYPMISAKNISNGRIDFDDARMLSSDDYQAENRRTTIERGDVLLTIVGAIGRSAVVETDLPMVFQRSVCVIKLNREIALSRYIHHVLSGTRLQRLFEAQANGAAQKGIYLKQIEKLRIPLPPLEIQREIVRILDTFSKMEAELEAELEARKQQYDHYLRKLTEPFEKDGQLKVGWNAAKIGQLCQLEKGTTPIQKATPGQYPLVVTAAERRSSSEYQFDSPASCVPLVSSKGHGVASISKVYFQDGKFALGNILCAIIPNDPRELSAEFITYFLQSRKDFLLVPLMRGGANVSLTVDSLRKVMICFPPREEQDRIVSVFRVLESLQDHEAYSLPAELSARRQQYEYYRDKLLTFKELEAAS